MKYKPLDMFVKQTDELKELIAKYPDYPIVVMVDSEVVADDGYTWYYAPCLRFGLGEILDCEQDIDDEKVYTDRDEFEEDMYDKYTWDEEYDKLDNFEFDEMIEKKLNEYEPYWKKVIVIYADI